MKNPTYQELISYVDGVLEPERRREIEQCIARSASLKQEIVLLQAMQKAVQDERTVLSDRFTANVLGEALPRQRESLWYRAAKSSSNIVALAIVMSMIGFALVYSPDNASSSTTILSPQLETVRTSYQQAAVQLSQWMQKVLQPLGDASRTMSGKVVLFGSLVFFFYALIDGLVERRLRIRK